MLKSYKDLDVWKRGMELTKKVYVTTKEFPKEEIYGLVSQIRRCAVSIPSNIAEGKTRQHRNEYIQFLYIALGSCAELETQLALSKELIYISHKNEEELLENLDHIGKMIRNLIKSLREPITYNREPITKNR